MTRTGREIVTFVALVAALSSVPYALIVHNEHLAVGGGLVVALLMWCPGLAALIACRLGRIELATLGCGRWSWRHVAIGYATPLLYAIPVYLVAWLAIDGALQFEPFAAATGDRFGFPTAPTATTIGVAIPLTATIGVISALPSALGEELGWRGYLLPRLVERYGFSGGCLVSGAIWAAWHYPALLFADYRAATSTGVAITAFTMMVLGLSFVTGWLRMRSASVWPVALLHASHNTVIQAILDPMTAPTGRAPYITTEFGFGLAAAASIAGAYLWLHRGKLARPHEPVRGA